MDQFKAINTFGSLTANGQKLKFQDFDKNNDGIISETEYKEVLTSMKLDSVELSNIDNDNNKNLSKEEFEIWEQKILMQDAVNGLASKISSDFSGKSQYLEQLTNELNLLINDYVKTYYGDISNMAKDFILELPEKYNSIKQAILANDPSTISANVIYEMSLELAKTTINGKLIPSSIITRFVSELNLEATRFMQNYTGNDFAHDLRSHLDTFLNTSEFDTVSNFIENFKTNTENVDDNTDFKTFKEETKILLKEFVNNGIKIKLNGLNILTETIINTAVERFTKLEDLKNAINEIISNLNTNPRKEVYIEEETEKLAIQKEKDFIALKGSNYKIDLSKINYDVIGGYSENNNIYKRGKGWSGSKDKAWQVGSDMLNEASFKNQIKSQIDTMLKDRNLEFSKIETVFENVYSKSIYDTLSSDGMITGRGARGFSSKGKAYISIKDMVDTFLSKFNINIENAINSLNVSNKDVDIVDIDYEILNQTNDEHCLCVYKTGKIRTKEGSGSDYYLDEAKNILQR